MIGFYDYSVWLTYISLVSAVIGIGVSLNGPGHPYWGIFFLMISGFCDAFDGRVARSKKDRTDSEKRYGVQIDSLSDLVAFGVLPACIGAAMASLGRDSEGFPSVVIGGHDFRNLLITICVIILLLYVLAAMIRLGYFNVLEEERPKTEQEGRKSFVGLPVTSASLIFPLVLLFQYILPADITPIYFAVMLLTAILFVAKIEVKKPGLKGVLILVAIGLVEAILLVVGMFTIHNVH